MTASGDPRDAHRTASAVVDVLLGGQDGLVNVLGFVLGVAAATESTRVVVAAGVAGALAESISMAAVAFTTRQAEAEHVRSERARERRHVAVAPELEREEVRALFAKRGFSGELLDRVVETITANEEAWVELMLSEELGLREAPRAQGLRSALVVGGSALLGSLIPLAPFLLFQPHVASIAAVVLSAAMLFAFGAYKARLTVGSPLRSGLVLAAIGLASALAGYAAGLLFAAK